MLSVVVRYHAGGDIKLLKDALFSLAVQSYSDIQIVLVCLNLKSNTLNEIKEYLSKVTFQKKRRVALIKSPRPSKNHLILNLKVKKKIDQRARMLNEGIRCAQGRYLAFLDYDDIVYETAYSKLIERIKKNGAAISFCGVVEAAQKVTLYGAFTKSKRPYTVQSVNITDLFVRNYFPLHSFVIDRNKISKKDLAVDPDLAVYEDYYLLLKLAFKYSCDLSLMSEYLCEYRIRDDFSNASAVKADDYKKRRTWERSIEIINDLKYKLFQSLDGGPSA